MNKSKMNVETLVSVIVPVFNREHVLRETMDSICNQTYKNLEIIVIDDGSTDNSLTILREYAEKDERVRVLEQQHRFAGAARNLGMQAAHGKYFSFLDSDDLFEPSMYEMMVARAEETRSDVVICKSDTFKQYGDFYPMPRQLKESYLSQVNKADFQVMRDCPEAALLFCIGWAWDKLFLADFVKKHEVVFPALRYAEDAPFVFPLVAVAPKCSIVDKVLVHYRQSDNQVSAGSNISKNPLLCLNSAKLTYQILVRLGGTEAVLDSCRCWMADYVAWTLSLLKGNSMLKLLDAVADWFDEDMGVSIALRRLQNDSRFFEVFREFSKPFKVYLSMLSLVKLLKTPQSSFADFVRQQIVSECTSLSGGDFVKIFGRGSLETALYELRRFRRKLFWKGLFSSRRKRKLLSAKFSDSRVLQQKLKTLRVGTNR